ncbi:hypothetical protein CPC08DRAFT_713185 [Agrocybe pediades]|nr:hypothetical protein CPC08DRAFT_713185 [Agrocybe pediades]
MIHSPASIRPGQQSPFISVRPPSEDGEDDGNGNDSIIRGWNLQATRGSPPPPGQFMHYAYDGNHSHALSLDVRALPPTGHSRMSESPSSSVSTHSNAPPWPEPRVSDTWPFIQKSIANHAGNELPQLTFTQETHRKHKHKHKRKKHNRGHRSTENSLVLQYPPYIGLATSPSSPQVPYNVVSYPPPPQIQPNANAYFAASPHHYPGLTQSRSHSPQPYANSQPSPAPPMSVEGRMDYQPVIPSRIDPTYERGADNACPCVSWK